jgi:hypothetical protein
MFSRGFITKYAKLQFLLFHNGCGSLPVVVKENVFKQTMENNSNSKRRQDK